MADYKFDIDGKQLSSEQINTKKNFDQFHKGFLSSKKSFYQKSWFWASTGLASLAIVFAILFSAPNNNDKKPTVVSEEKTAVPFINKPFKNLSVQWEKFFVKPEKGGTFINRLGSKITIPKWAFRDKKGKLIKTGEVEVRYREFHDVADQIISGIPMTYDSAGTRYMFSSAGMVEIRGFVNDSAVDMAPDKSIKVAMQSNFEGSEYNFYCLNEKERNWDCLGKDSVVSHDTPAAKDSVLSAKLNEKYPKLSKADVVVPESTVETALQKVPEYQKLKRKQVQIQNEITELKKAQPAKPIKADQSQPNFSLDIIESETPELAPYKDVQFQLAANQKINADDTKKNWNKVDVKKVDSLTVEVTFSKTNTNEHVSYLAIPVLEGAAFDVAFNKYQNHVKKVQEKENEFDRNTFALNFLKNKTKTKCVDKALLKAELARLDKIAFEKAQLMAEQQKEFASNFNEYASTTSKVTRFFKVNSFGVFNCDHPIKMDLASDDKVKKIQMGESCKSAPTIAVFRDRNGLWNSTAEKSKVYKRYKNSTIVIAIVDEKLGVLKEAYSEKGNLVFQVKGTPKSKDELEEWLGI